MHQYTKHLLVAVGTIVVTGCSKDKPTAPQQQNEISWQQNATNRRANVGETFTYFCAANGQLGTVWGTDLYTDDSSICSSGVHAGKITRLAGGTVTIQIMGPGEIFVGSARNGVTSLDYGEWDGSYIFK